MRKKQKNRKFRKSLDELFPEEWTDVVRNGLKSIEESQLDKPHKSFSNMCKLAAAWKILGHLALEYADAELRSRIVEDAETICSKVGSSLIEEGATVGVCLTKRHEKCTGSYVNVKVGRSITCLCFCHRRL